MTKNVYARLSEAWDSAPQKALELFSDFKNFVDTAVRKASSVLDSASEIKADAMDWIRQKFPVSGDASVHEATPQEIDRLARAIAPVVWLMGKTGAGKSSIVAKLTGVSHAEVGNGYEPCTRTTSCYSLPKSPPIVRFLDTRGLEEPDYDPAEDITFCLAQAHLIIVVIRATDPLQAGVFDALQKVRKVKPDWPVIVVQTGLHRSYLRRSDHPATYAFDTAGQPLAGAEVPRQLVTQLALQRTMFNDLKGGQPLFVPVDFTEADDGFPNTEYGKDALVRSILVAAPDSIKRIMRTRIQQEKTGATNEQVRAAYIALLADAFASVRQEQRA